jgi:DNA polymerase-1
VAEYGQEIRRAFTHKALNAVLQGSSADLTKLSMVKIWEAGLVGPGAPLTLSLTVHDELDGSAPDTPEANAALDEAHHIMANAIQLKIPVLVDSKTGANWAEAH